MKSGMLPGALSRAKILRALFRFLLFPMGGPLSLLNGGCDLVAREACNGVAFALHVTTDATRARNGSTSRLAQARDMADAGDADKVNPTAVLADGYIKHLAKKYLEHFVLLMEGPPVDIPDDIAIGCSAPILEQVAKRRRVDGELLQGARKKVRSSSCAVAGCWQSA
ncbi:unnamed protein product [Amoebophrya sp. A120]|nr:unnamed protein product [Amoebophrya sp. A120]|eukprot:GSA120T00021625001.1